MYLLPVLRQNDAKAQAEGIVRHNGRDHRDDRGNPPLLDGLEIQEIRHQIDRAGQDEVETAHEHINVHDHHRQQDQHADGAVFGQELLEEARGADLLEFLHAAGLKADICQHGAKAGHDKTDDHREEARRIQEGVIHPHALGLDDHINAKQNEHETGYQILHRVPLLLFSHVFHSSLTISHWIHIIVRKNLWNLVLELSLQKH